MTPLPGLGGWAQSIPVLGQFRLILPIHLSSQYLRAECLLSIPSWEVPFLESQEELPETFGFREWERRGDEGRAAYYQNFPFPLSSNPRTLRGQGPKVSGNGAALFEMFSYLIPCPGKGPSFTLRVAPSSSCLSFCPDRTPQVLICCLLPSFTPMCFSSSLALSP